MVNGYSALSKRILNQSVHTLPQLVSTTNELITRVGNLDNSNTVLDSDIVQMINFLDVEVGYDSSEIFNVIDSSIRVTFDSHLSIEKLMYTDSINDFIYRFDNQSIAGNKTLTGDMRTLGSVNVSGNFQYDNITISLSDSGVLISMSDSDRIIIHDGVHFYSNGVLTAKIDSVGSDPTSLITYGTTIGLFLRKDNNLSDITNDSEARINLGAQIDSDIQSYNSIFDTYNAINIDTYGASLTQHRNSTRAKIALDFTPYSYLKMWAVDNWFDYYGGRYEGGEGGKLHLVSRDRVVNDSDILFYRQVIHVPTPLDSNFAAPLGEDSDSYIFFDIDYQKNGEITDSDWLRNAWDSGGTIVYGDDIAKMPIIHHIYASKGLNASSTAYLAMKDEGRMGLAVGLPEKGSHNRTVMTSYTKKFSTGGRLQLQDHNIYTRKAKRNSTGTGSLLNGRPVGTYFTSVVITNPDSDYII